MIVLGVILFYLSALGCAAVAVPLLYRGLRYGILATPTRLTVVPLVLFIVALVILTHWAPPSSAQQSGSAHGRAVSVFVPGPH